MNTTTLYERFPTEEERDLWRLYQRHLTYAKHASPTSEERLWNENECDLIQLELMELKDLRLDKEEFARRKAGLKARPLIHRHQRYVLIIVE